MHVCVSIRSPFCIPLDCILSFFQSLPVTLSAAILPPPTFSHTTIPTEGMEWSTHRVLLQQSLSALQRQCLPWYHWPAYLPPCSHPLFPIPRPHQGIEWSTDRVLQQSLSALHTNGVADVAPLDSLPRLRDIDTVHDLTAWLAEKQLASREDGTMKADGGADVEENAALTDCGKAGNGKDGSRTEQTSETAEKEDASLSGCGKTGHTDDALRAEHVGVHWTSHAPGVVSVAVVGGMEGGTEAMSLITVVARILGQVSPVGAM
ncbi:unnamed protein product [Closterium sp. NIES-54]